jgi:hypothetical protein
VNDSFSLRGCSSQEKPGVSEDEFQGYLHRPVARFVQDLTEIGAAHIAIGIENVRMIEHVVRFGAEVKLLAFRQGDSSIPRIT